MVGLRNPVLGGLSPQDIQIVAAFDIDERKVGKDLSEAIFANPNNAPKVADVSKMDILVHKGPQMDGVGKSTESVVKLANQLMLMSQKY